jgi:hypothetical protein
MTPLLLILSLVGGALGAFLYLLAVRRGLLDDVEETKYTVFRDEDDPTF